MKSYKPKKYVYWAKNEWRNNCRGNFEFTLFYYSQGKVYTTDCVEHFCFIVTLFNFSFVLRIRKD